MPNPEPNDWIIRLSAELLLIFAFMLILLPSLWKLAMSRPGLIIVFSRVSGKPKHGFSYRINYQNLVF
jgi:hypothetical protein